MNSQEQEHTPSFELPKAPLPEQGNVPIPEQGHAAMTETQGAIAVETGAVGQSVSPQAPSSPAGVQGATYVQDDQSLQMVGGSAAFPQIADDNDLIEKEWVLKAKEIVAQTSHDPHLQNRTISRFKADYLKKRYNKDIKLSEDT